jgi:predicted HTH transcriptional regulator
MELFIDTILRKGEGRRIEFKATLPAGNQIVQTVIAFANSVGGELFVGIDDPAKTVLGVPDSEIFKMEELISQMFFDNCQPLIIPDITIYPYKDKNILCIKVYPSKNGPYYLKSKGKNKGTYIRVGSTNRLADEAILSELERRRRNVSFDSLPVYDVTPHDCDLEPFKKFYQEKSGKAIKAEQLRTLELVKTERAEAYLVNAALLFAANQIKKQLFPYAKIECARFKDRTTAVMIDQQSIDGPIYAQPEEAMKFIMRNISQGSTIGLVYRQDRWEYPLAAIREVVINAVVHRDYSILGSDIKIAIFDDMLEITSPGPLMPSVSPDFLENTPSEIRNRVIAPIFKECKLIEQWGSGFRKIYADLAGYPHISLKINEPGLSFQVQFIKTDYVPEADMPEHADGGLNGGLNGGLKSLLDAIKEHAGIQIKELAEKLDRPIDTLDKQIRKLTKLNLIERQGSKKTGGYQIVKVEEKRHEK